MDARQPTPSAQLAALLARFPPEIVALAKRCLPKLRRALPGSWQIVYDYRHSVVVSFSPTERGYEGVVTLAVYPAEVRLYFGAGTSLPDPKGLLQGSAAKVRYVTIEAASDLDRRDIKALFEAAIERSGATFPQGRPIRMVIKPASKTRKPAKAADASTRRR